MAVINAPRTGDRVAVGHGAHEAGGVLAAARRFHQRYERRLVREHGREAVANLRALLTAMAGDDQAADPRLRALHL